MIRSMTGFASVSREQAAQRISVTVKSVNHRFLDIALKSSLLLAPAHPAYAVLAGLQLAGYALGIVLYLRRESPRQARPARVITYFLVLNWAFCVASWRYATGNYRGSWRRTTRSSSSA